MIVGQSSLDQPLQVDPVLLTNMEAILWNPGTDANALYSVEFLLINTSILGVAVTVGQDIGAGGGLTAVEQWVPGETILANASGGWRGPFWLPGDDDVRGSALTTNVISIHWRIKRIR